jgi:hypothetical protein
MAGVVLMAREAPVLIAILLGAATYGGGSLLMGTVSLGDLERVRRYVGQRRRLAYA